MKLSEKIQKERFYGNCGERAGEWAEEVAKLENKVELMEAVIFEHNELIEAAHYQIKRAIAQLKRPESAGAVKAQLEAYLKGE